MVKFCRFWRLTINPIETALSLTNRIYVKLGVFASQWLRFGIKDYIAALRMFPSTLTTDGKDGNRLKLEKKKKVGQIFYVLMLCLQNHQKNMASFSR